MIVVRAPLRISFVGGGTDLPECYARYPGRVLSATINKYVYIALKTTELVRKYIVKYQKTEIADRPEEIAHPVVRAALASRTVGNGIEIASFADIPAKTGLGSSSSFTVALLLGLSAHLGGALDRRALAEAASDLEIRVLREPIGKQDQYAAAFGGFNVFEFRADESVGVERLSFAPEKRELLEKHLLLFFTGQTRRAGSVLSEQRSRVAEHLGLYKEMSDSVPLFKVALLGGEMRCAARMLDEGWQRKKRLGSKISNEDIDRLYECAIAAGAWGGKVLGAGGGGCLLFFVPPPRRAAVGESLRRTAGGLGLSEFQEISFKFADGGAEVVLNLSS